MSDLKTVEAQPFEPQTAMFVPGFAAGRDCALAVAFRREAERLGIQAYCPELIEVEEGYTVIPPFEEQIENPELQEGLKSDVLIAWSAGVLVAHEALAGRAVSPNQRIVLLNPSMRQPTYINNIGRGPETFSPVEEELASEYDGVARILPGASAQDRLIAVSKHYIEEISSPGFEPPLYAAKLLSKYASVHDLHARIIRVRNDVRLTPAHEGHMAEMRQKLGDGVLVGIDTLDKGTHFLTGQELDVMRRILSGAIFTEAPQEVWSWNGIEKSSERSAVSVD